MRYLYIVSTACWLCLSAVTPVLGQEEASTEAAVATPTYEEAVATQLATVPQSGSRTAADANYCATCHTEPALWDESNQRLFIAKDVLEHDIHWQKGITCVDCHGGQPDTSRVNDAHARESGFRATLAEIQPACIHCHKVQYELLQEGLHAHAGPKDENGQGTPLTCVDCHGPLAHSLLPTSDHNSPLFADHQVALCGKCHEKSHDTYVGSVHGLGLFASGLAITATCADCHNPHGPFPVSDERSAVHGRNVIQTCGQCHLFIQERLNDSVHHWRPEEQQGQKPRLAPGGTTTKRPVCTSCHMGHEFADPRSVAFRDLLPTRCGSCHERLSAEYQLSLHGQLTNLGFGPAAKCSDCHGSHDILPIDDPDSRVFGVNRVETCRQCHPGANANFASFDPHADYHDPKRSPFLHYVFLGMETLLYSVFGFFGLHTLLWFIRSIIDRIKHGRPRRLQPGAKAFVRFEGFHRALHVVVIVSFLGLALTGLPLKYSDQAWAKSLANVLGGFQSTSFWHRVCALMTISYFTAHLIWLGQKIVECRAQGMSWRTVVFGPDSMVPNPRDFRDLYGMVRWFWGLGAKPTFERWTYWEKFDYWAVFWGVGIIGTSGLLLWFPEVFCRVLPGQVLNVAKVVHSEEALLATGFIFTIHFFNTHLRAEKFPMDMSMLTGLVSEEELTDERPELVERLRKTGQLDRFRMITPSRRILLLTMVGGFIALGIGLALLIGILIAVF